MMPGDLVTCKSDSTLEKNPVTGIVLSEPEMFGFIQRVFVMFSTESSTAEEWIDAEYVTVVAQHSDRN